ncbi:MAG: HAD family phosphatase [Candidatus Rokuibacteriota bacterium]
MSGAEAHGVIFDMDGVLIDSGAHHRAAWAALLEDEGVTANETSWRLTIGRPAEEAVALLLRRALPAEEARRLAERKREHYARFAGRGVQAIAGVSAFVAELERLGVKRAVATSATRHDVERLLGELRLRERFHVIVAADDVRWGKPNPEVYLRAAEGLALRPSECLVFEDAVVGVHAARNAGMRVIGVTTAHTGRELIEAGAERAIANFEGFAWPV